MRKSQDKESRVVFGPVYSYKLKVPTYISVNVSYLSLDKINVSLSNVSCSKSLQDTFIF